MWPSMLKEEQIKENEKNEKKKEEAMTYCNIFLQEANEK
jgi:hypothetical protein